MACTLTNCTLEYAGEPVSFEQTKLSRCKYMFVGQAKRTVLFLQETGLMPFDPSDWGEFPDGDGHQGGHALMDGKAAG